MKKICFLADRFFWEKDMKELLYQEISNIIEKNKEVEF